MLEVVSVTQDDELRSVQAALAAGVDWILGGTHSAAALPLLEGSSVKYCPFPGRVVGHPSILQGSIEEIARSAAALTSLPGVYGLDLLAYRHQSADIEDLTRAVVNASAGPVIAAGSVVADDQIRMLASAGAWGFTIGSAIFDGLFPGAPDVAAQVRHVLDVASTTTMRPDENADPAGSRVEKVRQGLLSDLSAGSCASGTKLVNEQGLASRFDVSRLTVREAVVDTGNGGLP